MMRILVADDDREIVDLLNIYLKNEGYEVVKAFNGEEALNQLENLETNGEVLLIDSGLL